MRNISERLHLHVFNAGLEIIVGCAITWEVTHNFWLTVGAFIFVGMFAKSWSPKE